MKDAKPPAVNDIIYTLLGTKWASLFEAALPKLAESRIASAAFNKAAAELEKAYTEVSAVSVSEMELGQAANVLYKTADIVRIAGGKSTAEDLPIALNSFTLQDSGIKECLNTISKLTADNFAAYIEAKLETIFESPVHKEAFYRAKIGMRKAYESISLESTSIVGPVVISSMADLLRNAADVFDVVRQIHVERSRFGGKHQATE